MEKVKETQLKVVGKDSQFVDDKKKKEEFDKNLSTAIGVSIEFESNFKLYSYRIISHEVFMEKCKELAEFLIKKNK